MYPNKWNNGSFPTIKIGCIVGNLIVFDTNTRASAFVKMYEFDSDNEKFGIELLVWHMCSFAISHISRTAHEVQL